MTGNQFYIVKHFFSTRIRLYYKGGAWVADWAIAGASKLSEERAIAIMTELNKRYQDDENIAFDIQEVTT